MLSSFLPEKPPLLDNTMCQVDSESKTQKAQLLMAENLSDTKSSRSSKTSTKLHGLELTKN